MDTRTRRRSRRRKRPEPRSGGPTSTAPSRSHGMPTAIPSSAENG